MNHHYRAFGLNIASGIPLSLPEEISPEKADVLVRRETLRFQEGMEGIKLDVPDVGRFWIRDGKEILMDTEPGLSHELLSLYVLGSCMGAILYQRGSFLLHGSCIAKEGKGVLLIGISGVGKSTMAREFLSRGWQLVTDDVASIVEKDGHFSVQASYPAQKLWQDALHQYDLHGAPILQEERREKFSVNASACFREGLTPLKAIVNLHAGDQYEVISIEGIAKVDRIMHNLYRPFIIKPEDRERYFQRCVDLADEVPLFLGIRTSEPNGTKTLCTMLEEQLR